MNPDGSCSEHEPLITKMSFGYPIEVGGMLDRVKANICAHCGVLFVPMEKLRRMVAEHKEQYAALGPEYAARVQLNVEARHGVPGAQEKLDDLRDEHRAAGIAAFPGSSGDDDEGDDESSPMLADDPAGDEEPTP